MTKSVGYTLLVSIAVLGSIGSRSALAQPPGGPGPIGVAEDEIPRYGATLPPEVNKSIAVEKAQFRAQQRMARQAAQRWYGFSAARPQATGIPWTTMYSPAWAMPGGRPFGWHFSSRPVVVVTGAPAVVTYR